MIIHTKNASLVPLTYVQHRAIVASELGSNHFNNDPDQELDDKILREIEYDKMIRFGNSFTPIQGCIDWPCRNPDCKHNGQRTRLEVFASFSNDITDDISIFEPGEFIEIYFGILYCCNTIISLNMCT